MQICISVPLRAFWPVLSSAYYWILLICIATVPNRGKYTHLGCYVVDVSRSAEGKVFRFYCERLGRDLSETNVSSFLKFSTSSQNAKFHIHRSHMEIGLSELIKRGHTSCLHWKQLIRFRIWSQSFSQKMSILRFKDLKLLWLIGHSWSPKISNFSLYISIVCQENILWTSPFLLGGWISYQSFKKRGRWGLTWSQFLDASCWGRRSHLRLYISIVCQENILWTSPFLLGGWITYQSFQKRGRWDLTWPQFLDGSCWGRWRWHFSGRRRGAVFT